MQRLRPSSTINHTHPQPPQVRKERREKEPALQRLKGVVSRTLHPRFGPWHLAKLRSQNQTMTSIYNILYISWTIILRRISSGVHFPVVLGESSDFAFFSAGISEQLLHTAAGYRFLAASKESNCVLYIPIDFRIAPMLTDSPWHDLLALDTRPM